LEFLKKCGKLEIISKSTRKRFRRLPENEIFFPRSRKAKIITIPLKYSGTGIHILNISRIYPPQADYNLSLTQRLGKIAILGQPPSSK